MKIINAKKKLILLLLLFSFTVIMSCGNESDVVTLESGLKYFEDSLGTGREAKLNDLVTIHFSGWMIKDSTTDLFSDWSGDQQKAMYSLGNSKERNQTVKFVLGTNSFIKGSDEGIIGMKSGGKRTIIIPSDIAYGEKGFEFIPPNTDLKVVIELLEVKDMIVAEMWKVNPLSVKATSSGLKYAVVKEGEGNFADSGSVVTVHYTGYLENGTKFDSSVERDEPFSFMLGMGQVIPGWEEGLKLMKKGTKARLILPPNLAYGEVELEKIPANSTLIFDVEMLDIQ
jgi:peptidylprolyl isomerase